MKSMPGLIGGVGGDGGRDEDQGGYRRLMTSTFRDILAAGGAPPVISLAPMRATATAPKLAVSDSPASGSTVAAAAVVVGGGVVEGLFEGAQRQPPIAGGHVDCSHASTACASSSLRSCPACGDCSTDRSMPSSLDSSPSSVGKEYTTGDDRRSGGTLRSRASSMEIRPVALDAAPATMPAAIAADATPPILKASLPYGDRSAGVLAVVYDKNPMEAGGYAAALADAAGEPVILVEFFLTGEHRWGSARQPLSASPRQTNARTLTCGPPPTHTQRTITTNTPPLLPCVVADPDPPVRFDAARRMHVRAPPISKVSTPAAAAAAATATDGATWLPVRAAFRYVTQRPWTRLPISCSTPMINPILPCLAGGRNKAMAARAYDMWNAEMRRRGWPETLSVRVPETVRGVRKADVPRLVQERFGGRAVVKVCLRARPPRAAVGDVKHAAPRLLLLLRSPQVPYGNAGQGVYT